jgi:predicted nucleotidyltransferase
VLMTNDKIQMTNEIQSTKFQSPIERIFGNFPTKHLDNDYNLYTIDYILYMEVSMLEELLSSKARVEILKLFILNAGVKYYQRQVSLLTDQPIRAVQREVQKLERIGIISKSAEGNRNYYTANRSSPIFKELKGIVHKTTGLAAALRAGLKGVHGVRIAFIYGSCANDSEGALSDIDLMVIGDISSRSLSGVLAGPRKELMREINYAVFKPKEFSDNAAGGDHFIKTVLKGKKIFLIGEEDDLKEIIRARQS